MKKIIILSLIALLAGCKTRQTPVIQVPVKTVERRVTTLVPVVVPGDSAVLRARFECDSLNNVLLKGIAELKSRNMSSDFSFNDGILEYGTKTRPDTVYLPSDTVYSEKEIPVPVEVEKETNVLTKWQMIRIWIGNIILSVMAGLSGYGLFKLYLNFRKL